MLTARKFCIAISVATGLFQSALSSELSGPKSLLSTGMNALGYAGWQGDLNAWWDLGTLEVSPNLKLPIRFNFSSMQNRSGNSILGWNWWMPLMESNVMKDKEDHISAHLLGGQKIDLWKSAKDPLFYQSPDHKWEARVDERGNFRATNRAEGIVMDFFRGQLKSISLKDGETLTWEHDPSGKPLNVRDSKRNELVTVNYDRNGFPESIEFLGEGNQKQRIKMKVDRVAIGLGQVLPALSVLDTPENTTKAFKYSSPNADSAALIAINRISPSEIIEENFVWNLSDGKIVTALQDSYQSYVKEDMTQCFSKINPSGNEEKYSFNRVSGLATLSKNSEVVTRQYVASVGAGHNKVRSITKRFPDGKISSTTNFFDSQGAKIRSIQNGQSIVYIFSDLELDSFSNRSDSAALYRVSPNLYAYFEAGKGILRNNKGFDVAEFNYKMIEGKCLITDAFCIASYKELETPLEFFELINTIKNNNKHEK